MKRSLHPSTFEYLMPTDLQKRDMARVRRATALYAQILDEYVPEGSDKTYLMRKLREVGMWANVAITRLSDGQPRRVELDDVLKRLKESLANLDGVPDAPKAEGPLKEPSDFDRRLGRRVRRGSGL